MHPILQIASFLLPTLGFAACAVIFIQNRREIRRQKDHIRTVETDLRNLRDQFPAELAEIRSAVRESEERTGMLVPPTPAKSGMNLSKRSQAIRMSRLGESPKNIAAALSLPRREVELLLKVQKIVLNNAGATT